MKKNRVLILVIILMVLTLIATPALANMPSDEKGNPFDALLERIVALEEQVVNLQERVDTLEHPPIISTEVLRPNEAGSETSIDTQYPSSGSHYDKVDETTADGDSTYVENKNGAVYSFQRDLYHIGDHSEGSGTINKITITARTKFNAPAASTLKISIKTHGVVYDYDKTGQAQSVWHDISHELTLNPYTEVAWTWDEIDALEAGISLGGSEYSPDWSRCTQVYVEVEYVTMGEVTTGSKTLDVADQSPETPDVGYSDNTTGVE